MIDFLHFASVWLVIESGKIKVPAAKNFTLTFLTAKKMYFIKYN